MSESSQEHQEQIPQENSGEKIPSIPRPSQGRTVFRHVLKPLPRVGERAQPVIKSSFASGENPEAEELSDSSSGEGAGESALPKSKPRVAGRDIKPLPMGDGAPPPVSTTYKATLFWRRVFFITLSIVLVLIFGSSVTITYRVGHREGREQLLREQAAAESARIRVLPEGERKTLYDALKAMAYENDLEAATKISGIAERFPHVPSLKYLAAFAMLRAGRGIEAAKWANESIKANDRVGDCMAILAAIESDPIYTGSRIALADLKERQRKLLERAIEADPGSFAALLDIASLERLAGSSQKAADAYRLARSILPPVNQYLVIDVTLALIGVESIPIEELKPSEPKVGDVVGMFREAYVSFLLDDFQRGVSILRNLREVLNPVDFDYLMFDRAFRRFAYREELQEFFK